MIVVALGNHAGVRTVDGPSCGILGPRNEGDQGGTDWRSRGFLVNRIEGRRSRRRLLLDRGHQDDEGDEIEGCGDSNVGG